VTSLALAPRDYQLTAARDVWRQLVSQKKKSCVLVAPTGSGKTATASFIIQMVKKHLNVNALALAHRRELVKQTAERFRRDGMSCGTIMAGDLYTPSRDMQVGSVDTFDSWVKGGKIELPDVGLLVLDECHRAMGKRYQEIIEVYQERGTMILGLTATPIRSDGVGLGRSFNSMVKTPGMQWMIDHGYLVPVQYKVGIVPNLKGVKLTAGDYNQAQLQAVMNQKLLIGDVVENWLHHARDRNTMVFASGIDHSMHLCKAFIDAGISAVHIDKDTPQEIRDQVATDMLFGKVQVICNAAVYVEGTDIPWISCIVMAKPTKNVGGYLQMGGRGARPYTQGGKVDMMLLDHAGVVHAHGRLEMDRDWQLTIGKEMKETLTKERDGHKVEFVCAACKTRHTGILCPVCNTKVVFTGAAKEFLPATLVDMTQADFDALGKPKPKPKKEEVTMEIKQKFYAGILGYTAEKGRSHGYAANLYREKFGAWPTKMESIKPTPPTVEVKRFIQHRNIAFAKSKAREKVNAA
jgi:DNA repair protein RadD